MPTTAARRPLRLARAGLTAAIAVAATAAPLLIAGSASAAGDLVADSFDRTVASGWGTAATGGAWVTSGGGKVSVSGGAAKVADLPRVRSFAAYQKVTATDVEVTSQFTVSTAKDFQYSLLTRRQADGSSYTGRMRIDSSGVVRLELLRTRAGAQTFLTGTVQDLGSVGGTPLVLELITTSKAPVVVQAKLYRAGTTEPGWQVTALDSSAKALTTAGTTGLLAYNGPANKAVDLTTTAFAAKRSAAGSELLTESASAAKASATTALKVAHGAGPVGSAQYPVPGDAVVVSAAGSDTNPGTLAKPFRTVAKAVTRVRAGGTVVLRAGLYHESLVVPPGHAATIQPYPGEKVWFDGTRKVTGFKRLGSAWVAPWKIVLDASPTYVKGAPDGKVTGWQFVNPKHPMAAHPDMVWLGSKELTQVKSRSLVKTGTFYVDRSKHQLVLGSKPTGKKVRASDLQTAFSLRAPGTVLRGFGIRRYADSVWQQGVVTAYYPDMTLDNMTVLDSATGGIGFYKPNSTVKNSTVDGSGQIGIQASYADGLLLDNVSVTDSNDQQFNPGPSAGGVKVTRTRGVTLRGSEILRTKGNQFWADESTYNITATGNEILNGSRYGMLLEISSTAAVTDNVIAHNAYDGVMVTDTDHVRIWNNTIVANRRAVAFAQDSRRVTQLGAAGHDQRRPQPDLSMPWVIGQSSVSNNVLAAGKSAKAVLAVESFEHAFDADHLAITVNGNVYSQTALGVPQAAVVWARQGAQPERFVLLDTFRAATGQEQASVHALLTTPVDGAYRVKSLICAKSSTVAQALPSDLATKAGRTAGVKRLGAWDRPVA